MRQAMFELFKRLPNNSTNHIIFYKNNKKQVRTFKDFAVDIDLFIRKIKSLGGSTETIALIGPSSYEWMVLDFACIKGGYVSVAIPESLSSSAIDELLVDNKVDLVLIDQALLGKEIAKDLDVPALYFRCDGHIPVELNFDVIVPDESIGGEETNKIKEGYSIAFSSGTSSTVKQIKLTFNPIEKVQVHWFKRIFPLKQICQIKRLIDYKLSFWSRPDNKLIIYMPFSHLQQRSFVLIALFHRINIILSDPLNCAKHLIMEKPNIMVSVPLIYEVLADHIKKKVSQFKGKKRLLFKVYNLSGINGWTSIHPVKRVISNYLFKDICKIYGGRADYFITGSAPIKREALEVFYSVGVKILEAYGQSEVGAISMNTERKFKLGSVGKPVVEVKIGEHSEILVKYEEAKYGHLKEQLKIDSKGYIHTGDVGYLSRSGFLFLQGRLDDVIVLKNGKKIFPDAIDLKIASSEKIKQAVTICRNDKLATIVSLRDAASKKDVEEILRNVNRQLQDYSKINSYLIVPDLTVENGLLTSTFKIKRKEVIDRYKEESYELLSQ